MRLSKPCHPPFRVTLELWRPFVSPMALRSREPASQSAVCEIIIFCKTILLLQISRSAQIRCTPIRYTPCLFQRLDLPILRRPRDRTEPLYYAITLYNIIQYYSILEYSVVYDSITQSRLARRFTGLPQRCTRRGVFFNIDIYIYICMYVYVCIYIYIYIYMVCYSKSLLQ